VQEGLTPHGISSRYEVGVRWPGSIGECIPSLVVNSRYLGPKGGRGLEERTICWARWSVGRAEWERGREGTELSRVAYSSATTLHFGDS